MISVLETSEDEEALLNKQFVISQIGKYMNRA